jgi:hypothetical protein
VILFESSSSDSCCNGDVMLDEMFFPALAYTGTYRAVVVVVVVVVVVARHTVLELDADDAHQYG